MISSRIESGIQPITEPFTDPNSGLPMQGGISALLRAVEGTPLHKKLPSGPEDVRVLEKITLKGEKSGSNRQVTIFSLDASKGATVIVDQETHKKTITFVSKSSDEIEQYERFLGQTVMKVLTPGETAGYIFDITTGAKIDNKLTYGKSVPVQRTHDIVA